MTKIRKTLVLIFFVLLIFVAYDLFKANEKSNWQTYNNAENHFSVEYPENALVLLDKNKMASVGYIPTCDPNNGIACVYFQPTIYPKSNFDGAGVSFNLLSDFKNENDCLAKRSEETPDKPLAVNGLILTAFKVGDAAMSHQSNGFNYRTFEDSKCYEITTRINTTTFEVYAEGSIVKFTDDQRKSIEDNINEVLSTFTFN